MSGADRPPPGSEAVTGEHMAGKEPLWTAEREKKKLTIASGNSNHAKRDTTTGGTNNRDRTEVQQVLLKRQAGEDHSW